MGGGVWIGSYDMVWDWDTNIKRRNGMESHLI